MTFYEDFYTKNYMHFNDFITYTTRHHCSKSQNSTNRKNIDSTRPQCQIIKPSIHEALITNIKELTFMSILRTCGTPPGGAP